MQPHGAMPYSRLFDTIVFLVETTMWETHPPPTMFPGTVADNLAVENDRTVGNKVRLARAGGRDRP